MTDLFAIAERDMAITLERDGRPVVVTNPDGLVAPDLRGDVNDISQVIDSETGTAVSGSTVSVSLRISSLQVVYGNDLPIEIKDETIKPWTVSFTDVNGVSQLTKVKESNPDLMSGVLTLILEGYEV